MPRMLELIRDSSVPANIMRTAARGALALPALEMLEILVYLSKHPVFGEQARLTLAEWDEASAVTVASDPAIPHEVLDYMLAPANRRMAVVPALIENPAVDEHTLLLMASSASDEMAVTMLRTNRVRVSREVLEALRKKPGLGDETLKLVDEAIATLKNSETPAAEDDPLVLEAITKFETEHHHDIAAEGDKPFCVFVPEGDPPDELADLLPKAHTAPAHPKAPEHERLSTLQKIARLSVGERVQLAMKGTKDERFILVRDGSKVVCVAVLESPKLSDTEVEGFAAMKNVQEIVLRTIATKRKFMKHYGVVKQLANNPRTPLDVALTMLPHLMAQDLKFLSLNKNVSDTVRKLALKLFKDKQSAK